MDVHRYDLSFLVSNTFNLFHSAGEVTSLSYVLYYVTISHHNPPTLHSADEHSLGNSGLVKAMTWYS